MEERFERPGPPSETDRNTASGAMLLIAALLIGLVGIVLMTLGQFFAAPLVLLALGIWAAGKWKMQHHPGPPPSPPASEP